MASYHYNKIDIEGLGSFTVPRPVSDLLMSESARANKLAEENERLQAKLESLASVSSLRYYLAEAMKGETHAVDVAKNLAAKNDDLANRLANARIEITAWKKMVDDIRQALGGTSYTRGLTVSLAEDVVKERDTLRTKLTMSESNATHWRNRVQELLSRVSELKAELATAEYQHKSLERRVRAALEWGKGSKETNDVRAT